MTLSTWIVFGMTAFVFFQIGRAYQRKSDKELHKLAKDILEEAKKNESKKDAENKRTIWDKDY